MSTTKKFIGSGEDVMLTEEGPVLPEEEGIGLMVEDKDYQQVQEEEATC